MADRDGDFTLLDHWRLVGEVLAHPNFSRSDALILWLLLKHCFNGADECRPGIDRLVELSQLSSRTVMRSIQSLEQGGVVKVDRRGRSNRYRILFSPDSDNTVTSDNPVTNAQVSPASGSGDNSAANGDSQVPGTVTELSPGISSWKRFEFPSEDPGAAHPFLRAEKPAAPDLEAQRESLRQEYLQAREAGNAKHCRFMERTFPQQLNDLLGAA